MTGLRKLELNNSKDHLLVPYLLLLLQGQCCAGLESLIISLYSSITPPQLNKIVSGCSNLYTIQINKPTCTSDAVLIVLTRSCPHLQKITFFYNSNEVTEEGVLALAAHCRQLREIVLHDNKLCEGTVRQLAQHCRRLTKLIVKYNIQYSSKEIRALRETERAAAQRL